MGGGVLWPSAGHSRGWKLYNFGLFVRPFLIPSSYSSECDTSGIPSGNSFRFGTNVHLVSRIIFYCYYLVVKGERSLWSLRALFGYNPRIHTVTMTTFYTNVTSAKIGSFILSIQPWESNPLIWTSARKICTFYPLTSLGSPVLLTLSWTIIMK